jgi:hypothetical protein
MEQVNNSKNLCLIQYAHTINFQKRPPSQTKNLFTQKRIVAKGLIIKGNNKENEGLASQETKFNSSSELKTSRSSFSPRNLSLTERIEKVTFRNRNLLQVIRIREENIRTTLSQLKIDFNSKVHSINNEIKSLEEKKKKILDQQDLLKSGEIARLVNENLNFKQNIENINQKLNFIKRNMIDFKVQSVVKSQIKLLESYESEYIKTGQDLKHQLLKLRSSNIESETVQRFFKDKQELLEIFSVISKLKYVILKRIEKLPIKIEDFDKYDRKVENFEVFDIVERILEKSKNLRMLVSDKFAEDYTEVCKNM